LFSLLVENWVFLEYRFDEFDVRIVGMEVWVHFFLAPIHRWMLGDFEGYSVSGINCGVWDADF
jgi:hypothetical protein